MPEIRTGDVVIFVPDIGDDEHRGMLGFVLKADNRFIDEDGIMSVHVLWTDGVITDTHPADLEVVSRVENRPV